MAQQPVSTFSIDVDTGAYANVRRFLNDGSLPPKDAVRLEELVNYFPYAYPKPEGDVPFSVATELATTPWNPETRLLRVAIKAARATDPVVDDLWELVEDPRMEYVDFGLQSVRDSIEYLATAGLVAPERVAEIISGTLV